MKRGQYLKNKKSGKIIMFVESFPYLGEETNWEQSTCYRCYVKKGQYKYIVEKDLSKYEMVE